MMKRLWFVLLAPLSVLMTWLAHRHPGVTERWFSQGIYRALAATYGRVFGYLPFSVAQFLVILLPIGAVVYLALEVRRIIKHPEMRKKCAFRLVANAGCAVGVIFFMFTMLAGVNYARYSFGELVGLEKRPSSVEELAALTEILAQQVNELSYMVERDENGVMVISARSNIELARQARAAFQDISECYPVLGGFTPLPKPILYSRLFSRLRIVGIYVPFTMEAHVNVHVPDYHIPAIMLHELAHFRGFMREDEANFIAWLAGIHSGNPDFMYSAAMMAFRYASNQLSRVSPDCNRRIWNSLSQGVRADFNANREYWRQFEGRLAEISTAVNDAYLRANRQEDGVQSYGRMVDLLLAYHRGIGATTLIQTQESPNG